jgi:hypothetical protein
MRGKSHLSPRRIASWARCGKSGGLHGAIAVPAFEDRALDPELVNELTTERMHGKKVTKLKARTAYRFVIRDRSSIHDFHLSGPGLNRVLTSVPFTGTKSFVLRLRKWELSLRLRPALRDHARPLQRLLSRD